MTNLRLYSKAFYIPLLFLFFIVVFVAGRIAFMVFNHQLFAPYTLPDYLQSIGHGLKHDASVAGYFTALPGFLLLASCWTKTNAIKWISRAYFLVLTFFIAAVFSVDSILYEYWGFRLDSTPLFYLLSPKEALASTSFFTNLTGILTTFGISALIYVFVRKFLVPKSLIAANCKHRILLSSVVFLQIALLFLPIRGGVKESTMNVGKVYFSNEIVLNHAAINPLFSLFESLSTPQQFDLQYRFMPDEEATLLLSNLTEQPSADSIPVLFTTDRPNIVFVILESFMSLNMAELGGMPDVAVHLDSLARDGVLFANMYANSFRTDRALVSILSAFPAQPTTSLMKYPRKLQNLPSFPLTLKSIGYDLQYLYGGDADFTSMRSYLKNCGFEKIVEDISFPPAYNTTKWGVPDHHVFNRLYEEIVQQKEEPFLKIIQTQSSHNPFDVPFSSHHSDPYLNSVAYADSCLGDFVNRLRQLSVWDNTVIVLVPDHAMRYPYELDNRSVDRYKIPMVIAGGAVANKGRIGAYASQTDIAATLLYQLGIDHSAFTFSKNILNPASPHFGFFTFKDGFGMVSANNEYVYDNESKLVSTNTGIKSANEKSAKAYIQKMYDVLNEL